MREGQKLCGIVDFLFGRMVTTGVRRHFFLDDIMEQPEMRLYLAQDLLEEIREGGLG